MLVSEAKTLLKRAGFDDNDPLLVWLNAGLHEFMDARDWPFNMNLATVNAGAGAESLTLPADFRKVSSLRNQTTQFKLRYLNASEWEREIADFTTEGSPEFYTVIGDSIYIWPVTDGAYSFRLIYQLEVNEMSSDGAQMPGPQRSHYAIVQAAKYIALQDENEEKRAETAQTQFLAAIERLWSTYSTIQADEPEQVSDVMGYG